MNMYLTEKEVELLNKRLDSTNLNKKEKKDLEKLKIKMLRHTETEEKRKNKLNNKLISSHLIDINGRWS